MNDTSGPLQIGDEESARVAEEVVCTELPDDEAVLLHVGTRRIFRLNDTGLFIWRMIADGKQVAEIGREVEQTFGIPGSQAMEDVTELVRALVAEGLITLDQGAGDER
jgi:hypothetical protein